MKAQRRVPVINTEWYVRCILIQMQPFLTMLCIPDSAHECSKYAWFHRNSTKYIFRVKKKTNLSLKILTSISTETIQSNNLHYPEQHLHRNNFISSICAIHPSYQPYKNWINKQNLTTFFFILPSVSTKAAYNVFYWSPYWHSSMENNYRLFPKTSVSIRCIQPAPIAKEFWLYIPQTKDLSLLLASLS